MPVLPGAAGIDVVFDATGTVAYATLGYYLGATANGAYASFDAGETWTSINETLPAQLPNGTAVGRLALALDPNDSTAQTLYAAAGPPNTSGALLGIYKTVEDRKSTRLNSSHANISYAVFCLKKKKRIPATCVSMVTNSAL